MQRLFAQTYFPLEKKEMDDKVYYLLKLGRYIYGKPNYYIWVSRELVDAGRSGLSLPCRGVIAKGEKSYVLRPGSDWLIALESKCGFRGRSVIIPYGEDTERKIVESLVYWLYDSPLGNWGESQGLLLQVRGFPLFFQVKATGRLYGDRKEKWYKVDLVGRELKITEFPVLPPEE